MTSEMTNIASAISLHFVRSACRPTIPMVPATNPRSGRVSNTRIELIQLKVSLHTAPAHPWVKR